MSATLEPSQDRRDIVSAFVHAEAALLDARRFEEWFELFATDGVLWVPGRSGDTDPNLHVSIIYEHLPRLKARIARLASGNETAEVPPSKTMRAITNLRWSAGDDGTVVAEVMMVIYQTRALSVPLLVLPCRVRYNLRPADEARSVGSFSIVEKRIDLLEVHRHFDNLACLL